MLCEDARLEKTIPLTAVHVLDMGALPWTILATVLLAVVLIGLRLVLMQRAQRKRQRENRQATQRLRSLVSAYRLLAGSFTPAVEKDARQVEEALAEVVLFGTLAQVTLAAGYAQAIVDGFGEVDYQPLVDSLRADLRVQLGLEALPPDLMIPPAGPGRPPKIPGMGMGGGSGAGLGGGVSR